MKLLSINMNMAPNIGSALFLQPAIWFLWNQQGIRCFKGHTLHARVAKQWVLPGKGYTGFPGNACGMPPDDGLPGPAIGQFLLSTFRSTGKAGIKGINTSHLDFHRCREEGTLAALSHRSLPAH